MLSPAMLALRTTRPLSHRPVRRINTRRAATVAQIWRINRAGAQPVRIKCCCCHPRLRALGSARATPQVIPTAGHELSPHARRGQWRQVHRSCISSCSTCSMRAVRVHTSVACCACRPACMCASSSSQRPRRTCGCAPTTANPCCNTIRCPSMPLGLTLADAT
jgi:hypothetical protein|eukprot:COSAG01_NODE_14503_length_1445_cov_7.037147_2_plen_163_part_00